MAAYAALVSLINTMEQIQNHPRLSTSFDEKQIESLGKKLGFLLDFVESNNSHGGISKEAEDLESQIASAAHAAEDVIESHIVDQILPRPSLDHDGETSSSFLLDLQEKIQAMRKKVTKVKEKIRWKVENFPQQQQVTLAGSTEKSPSFLLDLQKTIEDMDSIKEKVVKFKEGRDFKDQQPTYSVPTSSRVPLTTGKTSMVGFDDELFDQQPTYSVPTSSRVPLTTGKTSIVGFDDELIQLMDVLTGKQSSRHIISIVGMGGTGKTTLARSIFENLVIMQHFDVRAWATISQGYNVREILLELLSFQGKFTGGDELEEHELGERLYKSLSGRRYLIILDDMWSTEVWDTMKFFFPDNGHRSRVVITTRLSNVAVHCGSSCFRINFLGEDKSWNLFCQKVFGQEECPPELVEIGKKIVEQCKGLPLSIVVIGGLLRKSYKTKGNWQNVANNINSILNSRENGQCLDVLYLSYNQLPAHLKPCFLYMGTFQEDYEIRASEIFKLWVAEGFLKQNGDQLLEEIAEGYLEDLVDRNLILVCTYRPNGRIKSCRIHDLLRDLCISLAKREKLFCVTMAHSIPRGIDRERCLIFHGVYSSNRNYKVFKALQSASLARSLICKGAEAPVNFRLLRVLKNATYRSIEAEFHNVNLRYLACLPRVNSFSTLHSSISRIWNLQTLIIRRRSVSNQLIVAPLEIWKMSQLRHLDCRSIVLPDPPPSDEEEDSFLGNLQTLAEVVNFRWNEEACKRTPNIKKLFIIYGDMWRSCDDHLHYDISCLHKLESLKISCHTKFEIPICLPWNAFPSSLNKLSLVNCVLSLDNLTMIGSLPQLEVLKLERNSVTGHEWRPVNGEFLRLKFLSINHCELKSWNADRCHFPVLEKLVLKRLEKLNEIPWGIGEIPTLQLIRLKLCSVSAVISAVRIKEEQESLGNDSLQIQVRMFTKKYEEFRERVEIAGLSINNIQLEEW